MKIPEGTTRAAVNAVVRSRGGVRDLFDIEIDGGMNVVKGSEGVRAIKYVRRGDPQVVVLYLGMKLIFRTSQLILA